MARSARQLKILEIIAREEIDKQEDLAARLAEEGFNVTQATVSRDIRDMGIIKVLRPNGKGYKYTAQKKTDDQTRDRYHRLFKSSVISIMGSENIIVMKTESGSANSACALIDRLAYEEVLGAVAGDDTIIVVLKSKDNREEMIARFEELLNS